MAKAGSAIAQKLRKYFTQITLCTFHLHDDERDVVYLWAACSMGRQLVQDEFQDPWGSGVRQS